MDNAWKDKLRERFSDYSVPEPEGLWEGIEQGMAGKARRKTVPVWWLSGGIAAAAAVALVVMLRPSAQEQPAGEQPDLVAEESVASTPKTAPDTLQEPEPVAVPDVDPVTVKNASPFVRRPLLAENTAVSDVFEEELEPEETVPETFPSELETASALSIVSEDVPETVPDIVPDEPMAARAATESTLDEPEEKLDIPESIPDDSRPERAFSFGVYREEGQIVWDASQGYGMTNTADYLTRVMNDGNVDGAGLVRMLSANRASTFEANHRAPVRVGVTFSWSFLPWLNLSTGLNWTSLSSDFEESAGGARTFTRQDLGYLGVPLRLEAGTKPWKGFRVYAGAGPMVETCFLSKATTNTYIGDHLEGTVDSVPEAGGLLWSVGALAGAEYRINPHLGVYLAPGLEYHFDNGSNIRSAYSEKPLHWNVSLGLRFDFGQ